ncbi:uncharacterized protein LOC101236166 [Hydra vulgaris]|uniref:Uncharacterized protein LOC101236166 n=1 Tax=Hydra vulgaris TaxID=6087 RepID=A0ABM4CNI2_HYDVU
MKFICGTIIFLLSTQKVVSNPFQKQCTINEECKLDELCSDRKCVKILSNENIKNSFCITNQDCPKTYFCDVSNHICSEVKTIKDFMKKQTCRGVFKSYCSSDLSCTCKEHRMVCRERECVYEDLQKKRKVTSCQQNKDCSLGFICSNKKCIEDQSLDFLQLLSKLERKLNQENTVHSTKTVVIENKR